jgi:hypothetical protein
MSHAYAHALYSHHMFIVVIGLLGPSFVLVFLIYLKLIYTVLSIVIFHAIDRTMLTNLTFALKAKCIIFQLLLFHAVDCNMLYDQSYTRVSCFWELRFLFCTTRSIAPLSAIDQAVHFVLILLRAINRIKTGDRSIVNASRQKL